MHETISTHRVTIKAKNVGGKLESPNIRWCSSLISVSIINYQDKNTFCWASAYFSKQFKSIVHLCGEVTVSVAPVSKHATSKLRRVRREHTHACTHLNFFILRLFKTSCVENGSLDTGLGLATLTKLIKIISYRNAHSHAYVDNFSLKLSSKFWTADN